jgi:HEAT repeat protein
MTKKMSSKEFSTVKAVEILRLLEEPTEDRRPLKHKLQREASIKELIVALRNSQTALTRRILCDILAARRAKTAIPALIECLDDPSEAVNDDAAEAIGKIGSLKAGEALLNHFIHEQHGWYAIALGAIGYHPAIPYLIDALTNSSGWFVRGGAAWSLGELQAKEAVTALEIALAKEDNNYASERIREALYRISGKEQETQK